MPDMLIRGVRDDVHLTLRRRAREEHMSLQAYVAHILEREAAQPSTAEWLARLDQLPRVRGSVSGAAAVAAARGELP
jgi:plasmid stability protein